MVRTRAGCGRCRAGRVSFSAGQGAARENLFSARVGRESCSVNEQFARLKEITRTLREPGGCEWDRAQDEHSLRIFLLEEAYEVIEAIHREDIAGIREELGDLIFIVFFYSRLFEEKGRFSLEDVVDGVADKLLRRHPHVFGENRTTDVKEILKNWERIKAEEKASGPHGHAARPAREAFLPALLRAHKVQEKAARKGFDWNTAADVLPKLREETLEFETAVKNGESAARQEEELGDILFTIVNVMRHLKIDPEMALHRSVDKFQDRYEQMQERSAVEFPGRGFADLSLEQKESLWLKSR